MDRTLGKREKYSQVIKNLEADKRNWEEIASELLTGDMRDSLSELSTIDNHPADIGTELYERERDIALKDNFKHKIAAINAALERFDQGTYGVCEHCGQEIPLERLEALPYTTVCAECSRSEEKEEQHSFHREPVQDELLNQPFSRTFNDGTDQNAFDGEDSWQAVARYGTSEGPQDLGTNRDVLDPSSAYEDADEWIGAVQEVEAMGTVREPGRENTIHYSSEHKRG